jgi:hypothetical protein
MRFYQQAHRLYCGVDLHARTMYLCILDQARQALMHRNFPATSADVVGAARVCLLRDDIRCCNQEP